MPTKEWNYSSVFGNTKGDTKNSNLFHKLCTQESSPPNSEYCQTRSLCQVLQNEFMMQVGFICLQIALTAIPTIALESGERAQTRIFLSLCCSMLLSHSPFPVLPVSTSPARLAPVSTSSRRCRSSTLGLAWRLVSEEYPDYQICTCIYIYILIREANK